MEQNPLREELKIEKPKLKIVKDDLDDGVVTIGGYSFTSNIMLMMDVTFKDFYLCAAADDSGEVIGTFGIHSEEDLSRYRKSAQDYGLNLKPIKLNDKEKEAFLKVAMAHELRHCIQTHLLASTKECMRPFKKVALRAFENKQREYFKTLEKIKKIDEEMLAMGISPEPIDIKPPDYSLIEYCDNYVPKKLITEDTKLKFSMSEKDNRYLSTKDHILAHWIMEANNPTMEAYKASVVEMDANNYAYQYFCTKVKKDPEYADIRIDISEAIEDYFYDKAKYAMENMQKFGFPQLVRKG